MSASYILVFARVADEEKAGKIIEKYGLEPKTAFEISQELNGGSLVCEWANVELRGVCYLLEKHPESRYILLEDYNEAYCNDLFSPYYDYDFSIDPIIKELNPQNGFASMRFDIGEGNNP